MEGPYTNEIFQREGGLKTLKNQWKSDSCRISQEDSDGIDD